MTLSRSDNAPNDRQSIGGTPWQINGCPLKPTVLAVQGSNLYAAVHNGGEAMPGVIFSVSNDAGKSFKPLGIVHTSAVASDAPTIVVNSSRVLLAWHARVGNAPRRVFYRFYDLSGEPLGDIQSLDTTPGLSQYPVVTAKADDNFQLLWQQADRIWTTTIAGR